MQQVEQVLLHPSGAPEALGCSRTRIYEMVHTVEDSTREYWRDARICARQNTELWTRSKFVSGLVVGIVACIFQWVFGLRAASLTLQFILTMVLAWAVVSVGQFLTNWFLYAPVAIDRRRREQIEKQAGEISQLQGQLQVPPPLKVQFERMDFDNRTDAIYLHVKILNSGPATTLHNWTLHSAANPKISARMTNTNLAKPGTSKRLIRFEAGEVITGFLDFRPGISRDRVTSLQTAWVLQFYDDKNREHRATVPDEVYPRPQ